MSQTNENKGLFTYRPNPVHHKSWLIFKKSDAGSLNPVGDYTVLDPSEPLDISEKKIMNLVTLLNGNKELIPLGDQTKSRLLFHRKPKKEQDAKTEVIFYTQSGQGVSKENAILTIEGEFDA
jgi:hypothetical protein